MEKEIIEKLGELPPIKCTNIKGPSGCYCSRGNITKPIAEVCLTDGTIVRTFCSTGSAKVILGLGHEIYTHLKDPFKIALPSSGNYIIFIPGGVNENASQPKSIPRLHSTSSNGKKKRGSKSGSSGDSDSVPQAKNPRVLNPHCSTGNPLCYCHSGRARAIYRVDNQGNVLAEYCSQSVAASILGIAGGTASINKVLSGNGTPATTKGHMFRYKVEGDQHKRIAKAVLLIDAASGKVLQEFESAVAASKATGLSNTAISKVCHGGQPHVQGQVFRFKDESHKMARELELRSLHEEDEKDRPPSAEELQVAASHGVVIGVTEFMQPSGSTGLLSAIRIQKSSPLDATNSTTTSSSSNTTISSTTSSSTTISSTSSSSSSTTTTTTTPLDHSSETQTASREGVSSSSNNEESKQEEKGSEPASKTVNWFYVRYFDGGRGCHQFAELSALIIQPPPIPPPLPPFPEGGTARYSFDDLNRVVRVDLRNLASSNLVIDPLDEAYIYELFDRPDITVIIKGLAQSLTPHLWTEAYIRAKIGNLVLHKLKCFSNVTSTQPVPQQQANSDQADGLSVGSVGDVSAIKSEVKERDEFRSMTMNDYFDYLHQRDKDHNEVLAVRRGAHRKLKVGSRVRARFHQRSTWFRGRIVAVRGISNQHPISTTTSNQDAGNIVSCSLPQSDANSSMQEDGQVCYDIHYDDGDDESGVLPDFVRPCGDLEEMENTPSLLDGLYLIDFDITRHLPELYIDLERNFKMDLLPRGRRCLLRYLNPSGHPFMGPNLYITPPGSFTQFHQDGHGTVDSGHQCLRGSNEVIMLRRMDEANKRRALRILCGPCRNYDALYGKPHDMGEKPAWPNSSQIEELRALGYCPSVFTLEAGEYVHINKGRLHAFRKKAPEGNPATNTQQFCVSVAWDWIYEGSSAKGCHEEASSTSSCVQLNIDHGVASLAHIEAALLQTALAALSSSNRSYSNTDKGIKESILCLLENQQSIVNQVRYASIHGRYKPTDISQPSARSHKFGGLNSSHSAYSRKRQLTLAGSRGGEGSTINTEMKVIVGIKAEGLDSKFENGEKSTPSFQQLGEDRQVGKSDISDKAFSDVISCDAFICAGCQRELCNAYLQCLGCRELLNTSLNLCIDCHKQQLYVVLSPVVDAAGSSYSDTTKVHFTPRLGMHLHHETAPALGDQHALSDSVSLEETSVSSPLSQTSEEATVPASSSSCGCDVSRPCPQCQQCSTCSCDCHLKFVLRFRFLPPQHFETLTAHYSKV